jgi:hypothetical protein
MSYIMKGLTRENQDTPKSIEEIKKIVFDIMLDTFNNANYFPTQEQEFLTFAKEVITMILHEEFSTEMLNKGIDINTILKTIQEKDPSVKLKSSRIAKGMIPFFKTYLLKGDATVHEGYSSGITGGSGLGITKSPMEKVLEKPLGETEEIQDKYVVHVNGKPVTEYTNGLEAIETVRNLRKKYPDAKFKVVKIHCDSEQIAETEYGNGHQDDRKEREENLRYSRSRKPVADEIRKQLNPNQKTEKEPTKEGQIYSTGGGAGKSYRKFTPKTTGQLDEKCWDTHKQVGMKKKGAKMVPNCIPKEGIEDLKKGLETSVDSSLDAEKAVAKVLMNSPWFKANMQSENFIKLAKMWLAANRVFLKNHYPSLDFSDINELAHNIHNYYLYANKQLAETKSKSIHKKINKPKKNK